MRYVMKNEGFPYKNIYVRRNKVGRVYKNAQGTFTGMIGKTERTAATEREAFDAVVSADLGYAGVEELNAHNRSVRAANRRSREMGRRAADAALRGAFGDVFKLLDLIK